MLNHVEHASSAANAGVAISHSSIVPSAVGAISGGTALAVSTATPTETMEAGYWFLHAQVWVFTPQQVLQILGTICTLICTMNIVYQFLKSIKQEAKTTENYQSTGPSVRGGSGKDHPPIKPK